MIRHEPGDLVCQVSADVCLADLQAALAEAGQMLALDPPGADRLTVGEVFDAGMAGPRSHRYGEPRDLVLGMTVELADGTVARCGGRVGKNVAGYDLARLFSGAQGRLGSVRELWLRLHPLPAATCTLIAEPADPAPLEPLGPACVEYAWPPGQLLVRFESIAAAELARAARDLAGGELVEDDEPLWAEHRERAEGLAGVRCLPSEAPALIESLRAGGAGCVVGRLARGWLFAEPGAVARAAPERPESGALARLERRVVEAFAG
ncbi:MAG: FAD-binding oxidoreductase [Gaiellales bacterium]